MTHDEAKRLLSKLANLRKIVEDLEDIHLAEETPTMMLVHVLKFDIELILETEVYPNL